MTDMHMDHDTLEDADDMEAAEAAATLGALSRGVSPPPEPDPSQLEPLAGVARYTKIRDLGRGKFGIVQLARDNTTQELVAIKCVQPMNASEKYILAEILNHRKLQHPFVIGFKEVFITAHYVCLVMEYASGGNLYEHLQKSDHFSENASRWFFQQLIIGIDYCHKHKVVNRDIKLNNILVQVFANEPKPPVLKIADFGYAKAFNISDPKTKVGASLTKTKVGTLVCMAPEVLKATGEKYDGEKSDIWGCGAALYWMLFGQSPFPPDPASSNSMERNRSIAQRIVQGEWSVRPGITVSGSCLDLLRRILVPDPNARISIQDIYKHPWFLENLPLEAEAMKNDFLGREDYTKVQSEDDIRALISEAMQRWVVRVYSHQ